MAAVTFRPAVQSVPPPVRDGGRLVVQTWLFSRLLLVGVVLWLGASTGRSAAGMLANWDVQHYFAIATHGYADATDIAFFPGWPLVLRVFATLGVPMLWAGVGIAVICSALAAAALHRLGGPIAAVAWLLAPTTVFTLVPYTEAPFCAAAFWAWERAARGRWGAAAGLAAVACTLRVSGLFLVGALVILALTHGGRGRRGGVRTTHGDSPPAPIPGWSVPPIGWPIRPAGAPVPTPGWSAAVTPAPPVLTWRQRVRALAWLLIPALTLFAYAAYLYQLTGDWNAWYRAQSTGWPRGFTWPWVSLQHTLEAAASNAYPAFPEWSWVFRGEIISMTIGLAVTIICLVRRRWAEASWVGVQVLAFSCSYWFLSVNRAVLLWFPLFILIGELFSGRRNASRGRRGLRILLTFFGVLAAAGVLCFWGWLFFTGRWSS
ncbi:MAG: mannosyltransferase family protein [Micropruina sp.]|uniref:mannosyltransferase family protein n=1 Tax=Micropruina sp. TaxID=2737536 RepID=UPI0039E391B2